MPLFKFLRSEMLISTARPLISPMMKLDSFCRFIQYKALDQSHINSNLWWGLYQSKVLVDQIPQIWVTLPIIEDLLTVADLSVSIWLKFTIFNGNFDWIYFNSLIFLCNILMEEVASNSSRSIFRSICLCKIEAQSYTTTNFIFHSNY